MYKLIYPLHHRYPSYPAGKNFGDRSCSDDEVLEMMEAADVPSSLLRNGT